MPSSSAAHQDASLDQLHAIKNEVAHAAARRMLLETNASEISRRVAEHEAAVAQRLDRARNGVAPYGDDERVSDRQHLTHLLEERDRVHQALDDMDARREQLTRQADEALAQRYTDELASLSRRVDERLHRFFSLWKQVALVVKDIQELCAQHRQLGRSLEALRRQQGLTNVLPPDARLPRTVDDMHRALDDLPATVLESPDEPAIR